MRIAESTNPLGPVMSRRRLRAGFTRILLLLLVLWLPVSVTAASMPFCHMDDTPVHEMGASHHGAMKQLRDKSGAPENHTTAFHCAQCGLCFTCAAMIPGWIPAVPPVAVAGMSAVETLEPLPVFPDQLLRPPRA